MYLEKCSLSQVPAPAAEEAGDQLVSGERMGLVVLDCEGVVLPARQSIGRGVGRSLSLEDDQPMRPTQSRRQYLPAGAAAAASGGAAWRAAAALSSTASDFGGGAGGSS